jgi:hypothetical protein
MATTAVNMAKASAAAIAELAVREKNVCVIGSSPAPHAIRGSGA